MNICLGIIKDELPFDTEIIVPDTGLSLSRYKFLGSERHFAQGTLYLAHAADLPEKFSFDKRSAIFCIGELPKEYKRAEVPAIEIHEETDIIRLGNEISNVFFIYNELENKLNKTLREGGSLHDLVDIMAPFLKNRVSIGDNEHKLLAATFYVDGKLVPSAKTIERATRLPLEVINFFKNNRRWIDARTFTEPFIYDEGIFSYRLLCVNIISEVQFMCRVMIGETEQPYRSYDADLLVFFAEYVRCMYDSTLFGREAYATNSLADMLRMVISGMAVDVERIAGALTARNFAEGSTYMCAYIRPSVGDRHSNTIKYYSELLASTYPGLVAFEYKEDIICLINLEYKNQSKDGFLNSFVSFIRDNNFRAGISNNFKDYEHFRDYYIQAHIALDMGTKHSPSKWIYKYHEYAIEYILETAGAETGLRALCDAGIRTLYSYDLEKETSYIETLSVYFDRKLNAVQTAKDLGIHRATMVYRLKRIEELAGIDFEDTEKNLFYQLSIKMLSSIG